MKLLLTLIFSFAFTLGYSQVEKEDLAIIKAVFNKEKKALTSDYMDFQQPNSQFWTVYDAYEKQRSKLSMERLRILKEYAMSYETLTDSQINDLMKRKLKNDADFTSLQKSYYKKFAKAAGTKNAAKFIQLETYLQIVVRKETMDAFPYIGEYDR